MSISISVSIDGSKGDEIAVPAEMESSIQQYIASQLIDGQPKYADAQAVILDGINHKLAEIRDIYPPKSVSDAQAAVEVAKASVESAKETVLLSASAKVDVSPAPSPVEIIR